MNSFEKNSYLAIRRIISNNKSMKLSQKGFTLIELLVVLAIIGVLATIMLLAINPAEVLRKARDSSRLQEVVNLRKAIDAVIATKTSVVLETINCPYNTPCNSMNGTRIADGTGWLPIKLNEYVPVLPIDPLNGTSNIKIATGTSVTPKIYFASDGSSYKLAIYLESRDNITLLSNDGGTDDNLYEVGTNSTSALTLN